MNYEAYIQCFHEGDACSRHLGIRLVRVESGFAQAEMPFLVQNSNFMGGMHGGALATLADIAAGSAVFCLTHSLCVTMDASLRYLQGIQSGKAIAQANVIHAGKRTCVCQVDIRNEAGELCCSGSICMFVTDRPISPQLAATIGLSEAGE